MQKIKRSNTASEGLIAKINWIAAIAYTGTAILTLIILVLVLQLYKADLSIPLSYNGDGFQISFFVKGIIDNNTWLYNYYTGAPGGTEWQDFPMPNLLDFAIFKAISLVFPNYATTLNVYFILTFPLTAVIAVFVMRQFKIGYLPAIATGILYAFVPYHFLRGEAHFFLTSYYTIPLVIMIALWVFQGKEIVFKKDPSGKGLKIAPDKRLFLLCAGICVIAGLTGVYYAFFACLFITALGFGAAISRKDKAPLLTAIIFSLIVGITLIVALSPSIVYKLEYGSNTEVAQRNPSDSEYYGLKIMQLLLPIDSHRIPLLAHFKEVYDRSAPLVNENMTASLGAVGSLGFILLIICLFYRPEIGEKTASFFNSTVYGLSLLNITAVLWGTIGGFSALFAYALFPMIRSVNRVSIYIAFFTLFMVAVILEFAYKSYFKGKLGRLALVALVSIALIAGVLDQTTNAYIPDYKTLQSEYQSDDKFVKQIEATVPAGSMIFQLPYISTPEEAQVGRMQLYDHTRAYLHSDALRWSHGAMKGRETDLNYRELIASSSLDALVRNLSLMGFNGIYIDRYGYDDNGYSIESELKTILGTDPIVSDNSRLAFFDMAGYNQQLKARYTPESYQLMQKSALSPIQKWWTGGFSIKEGDTVNNWRWCSNEGELHLTNNLEYPRNVTMTMGVNTGYWETSHLTIESPSFAENLKVNIDGATWSKTFTVPPGEYVIKFTCDAQKINAPGDARALIFRVNNFRIVEERPA